MTTEPTISIDPQHLILTHDWPSGGSYNVHFLENGDLGVILKRGQDGQAGLTSIPTSEATVLVAVGVDGGDHDEVHVSATNRYEVEDLMLQAIEALQTCHASLRAIRQAAPADGRAERERNAFELGRDYERGQRQRQGAK